MAITSAHGPVRTMLNATRVHPDLTAAVAVARSPSLTPVNSANELERVGVAAFHPPLHDAGRLAPQARRATMARLASKGKSAHIMVINAQPRISGTVLAACHGSDAQTVR
jgi:hypothetical protein